MLLPVSFVNRLQKSDILLDNQVLKTEGLHSFEIVDGIADQQICRLLSLIYRAADAFLEEHAHVLADDHERYTAECDQRLLPAKVEADDDASDDGEERFGVGTQGLTAGTINDGAFLSHSTGEDTGLIVLEVKPANILLQDGVIE